MGEQERSLSQERLSLVHSYMTDDAVEPAPTAKPATSSRPELPAPRPKPTKPAPARNLRTARDTPSVTVAGAPPVAPEPAGHAEDTPSSSKSDGEGGIGLPIYAWVKAEEAAGEWRHNWPEELVRLREEQAAHRLGPPA